MIVVYGIKSCDTCRKARAWLTAEGLAHRFHDLRADGLTSRRLAGWMKAVGWEKLINRSSTTWRELPDWEKEDLDTKRAEALLIRKPTLVKRPVFETGEGLHIGFSESVMAALSAGRN